MSFKGWLLAGRLGGSIGWASDFGSGHDLTVREFEPRVGLCADSSEPGACFGFCVSLFLYPSPLTVCLYLFYLVLIPGDHCGQMKINFSLFSKQPFFKTFFFLHLFIF